MITYQEMENINELEQMMIYKNHNRLIFLHGQNLIEIFGKKKKKRETDIEKLS